ncbi:glycosyltransferase [Bacteroides fragilis]|nr:glycosyltransferase [Bacteroides fragilis]
MEPLVSICCITYNHVAHISQCLDGFLMQKTTFIFEILIHDDASTDGTADIIRKYVAKYPHLIKPVYQVENQYSKGVKIMSTYNYSRARGKYIALCEGDDYWIDPLKLQKQIDVLESDSSIGLVYTDFYVYDENEKRMTSFPLKSEKWRWIF